MTTYTGTPKTTPRRLLMAVGGAALALAVGTSLGAWRLTQHSPVSPVTSVSQAQLPVQQSSVPVSNESAVGSSRLAAQPQQRETLVQPHGGQAEMLIDARQAAMPALGGIAEGIREAQGTFVVHTSDSLVAVPAHGGLAETIAAARAAGVTSRTPDAVPARGGIAEALDAIRAQMNESPLGSVVLQLNPETGGETALRSITDENTLRATLDLPLIQVIDLRTRS